MLLNGKLFWRLFCLLFFAGIYNPCSELFAQRFEFGAGIGFVQYKGDLQPGYFLNKPAASAELIGRYNLSMAAVIRANLLFTPTLQMSSVNSPDAYVNSLQPSVGNNTFLGELGIFGEYNFFNYRNPKSRYIFGSPYLFGGPVFGLINRGEVDNFDTEVLEIRSNRDSTFKPGLPKLVAFPGFVLGVGYKQQLGQYFNLGIQFSGRFLFSDNFDGVSDREVKFEIEKDDSGNPIQNQITGNNQVVKTSGIQLGNKADRDSYYFAGFSLTYTIKEVICPFKYEKKSEKQ
jgi:hypothetical protein